MRIAVLFSGGKDSTFTTYYYLQQGWEVACLVNLESEREDSYMFQKTSNHITLLQAEALGIPLITQKTGGEKEKELLDLKKALLTAKKKYGIVGVAVGALFSDYQQERVNRICHSLDLKTYAPLWHKDQAMLLREMIYAGFKIMIQSIAADGLTEKWLGRILDKKAVSELEELKKTKGIHVAFEGGEAETIVLDGPIFRKKIKIVEAEKKMENECTGVLVVKKVEMVGKN